MASGLVEASPEEGRSIALGKSAMMTIVRSRMNSRAPVSLVTTTATNESSPDPPNSTPPWPLRRDRRMRPPSRSPVRVVALAARAVVEHLLHDVPVEGVALLHADVQQVDGVLQAVQGPGELLLGRPARSLVGQRPRVRERFDGLAGPVDPALDLVELLRGHRPFGEGDLDPPQ